MLYSLVSQTGDDDHKEKTAKVEVHTRNVKNADNRKTIVNVYINADKDKKKIATKGHIRTSGVPLPLATKARKVQLHQQSKYQTEMAEAKKLLGVR